MRKLFFLVLYAAYCICVWIFTKQEIGTGQADARYLLVAMATVPPWGIPLFLRIYRKLSRRRER